MRISKSLLSATTALLVSTVTATCDTAALNTTTGFYPITEEGTTIFDVAKATKRGVCDIARSNLMADVTIPPSVGESIYIPAQVCTPDNDTCILKPNNTTRTCINGGPRLYYTVTGDTYERVALRLNITTESVMKYQHGNYNATDVLETGQFLKIPQCSPSQCIIQPYSFKYGVYKDLAEKYGTTVGQIMMLSPTYNYSSLVHTSGGTPPPIDLAINCTALSNNVTILA
ncbi:hypothetical protein ASPWEDRAFT_739914 [Aspergillus wentii DTO 134E9]|uniref:LysM domain-containing protein n=1 Tax=Aspergillus wentii DTO 134E9 TaxID=1073089 RepID=A0A1L9RJF3_ASPWE|nr:uncharacterized protein ASPWEDRAFT_739914 [Aspergillus wentii DTO 134E9]KAI9932011.1 hypothetical protein MW887_009514 [Aspergillus wentii]OJJ35033.1 hypothetical protein ASPWEDRAFT_739914 [Aspergillus wentii DTO 134E9]